MIAQFSVSLAFKLVSYCASGERRVSQKQLRRKFNALRQDVTRKIMTKCIDDLGNKII
jgi:hypothetical protein